jgi:catechol 2,3-dioxygenase-like lactoylglutathione lyase family enzyme/uncharacterized protein YndB with AHSA1/START domain
MKPRISVITLGVNNLDNAVRFYRDGLGLPTNGIVGEEFEFGAVAFFDLSAGLKLALWPKESLAHDAGLRVTPASTTEFSIGHNVMSTSEVDKVMAQARSAGAVIVKPAQETFWGGYAGYFHDPDGHLWEVVWNPQLLPELNTSSVVVEAQMLIRRPVADVFEAFVNPEITTKFWFTKSSGRLALGKKVRWDWEMYGVGDDLLVKAFDENRRLLIEWASDQTTAEWSFVSYGDEATLVKIVNRGFRGSSDEILVQAVDSKGGYSLVLAGLKAWLEQGIELNLVGDHFPNIPGE